MKADLEEDMEKPKLEFKRSQNNKDFFTISNSFSDQKTVVSPGVQRQRRSSAVLLVQELLALTTQERTKKQEENDETEKNEEEEEEEKENNHTDESKLKTLVIELEQDDEFFKMLVEELQQVSMLQDVTTQKFKQDISELEHRMTKVVREPGVNVGRQFVYFGFYKFLGLAYSKNGHV